MPTLYDMIKEAVRFIKCPCSNSAIINYVLSKWSDQNHDSIQDQINSASVNLPSRVDYPENQKEVSSAREKYDFLYRTAKGVVEEYDPHKHGIWGILQFQGMYKI
ncbi:DUF7669 domain-containing protein [Thermoplasma acidophilum]|uniref:DUF7669 domain-containing protein n=1 Tax=Thermoplasma acidophilum TaxID=2303 RepID=UPI0012EA061C|nr:hypothetical protein [Thermoplasma acidophilum]